jgi:hypothetical protein
MIRNILSLALLLISAFLNFRHGWASLNIRSNPESSRMLETLGIGRQFVPALGITMIVIGFLLMIPRTFFIGNLLYAVSILSIMALALHSGNYRIALMEIPFLIMPLALIGLQYPFSN